MILLFTFILLLFLSLSFFSHLGGLQFANPLNNSIQFEYPHAVLQGKSKVIDSGSILGSSGVGVKQTSRTT